MAYITNADISNRFFEGETVPGDNSIDAARNTSYIASTTNFINGLVGRKISDGDFSDDYGWGKEYALIIYGRLVNNDKEVPIDDEADAWIIKQIVRKHGNVPLSIIKPSEDWDRLR
jgi:hypothetical protein